MPTCPSCGRELDPLRAGQVAFVGGKFVYFCDQEHKVEWLARSSTSVARDDVATAEPPAVAPIVIEEKTEEPRSEEEEEPPPPSQEEPRSMPIRKWAPEGEAPASLRAGPRSRRARPRVVGAPGWMNAVAYAGIAAGAFAVGVALVGSSGDVARLPLAVVACACALVYALAIAPRLFARPPWTGALPVVVACALAIVARATGAASAGALSSLAGAAGAAFIIACRAMLRAIEPLTAAREAIHEALDVPAKSATGETRSDVRAGEQVVVGEGETVPVDGVVASGEALVSPWLDADNDVTKREGAAVVAGARVITGTLRVTATWTREDRAYGKAFASAPLVQTASAIDSRALVPIAILTGGVAFGTGAPLLDAIGIGAGALAAFSPPVASFAVALLHSRSRLRALQRGIVHRDAQHFDRAGRAQIAVVCARGTVLLGEPEIVAIESVGASEPAQIIALASAVATGSSHPFAAAILRAARARGVRAESVRNTAHSGSGATAIDAQGERIVLGRRVFLLAEKVSVAVADDLVREHEAQGRSVLLVARGGKIVGIVALQDGLRAGARAAVQKLHDAHIEPVLLSGEARETCEAIARALDIEHLRPEVDGPDRGAEVRALAERGDLVAVLGHPSADDSALGAADVSVALDAAGASPGEWSVALASDDVRAASEALAIPRVARERSTRTMAVALAPGVLASLALALALIPSWTAPVIGALAASVALIWAKD
jgi:cation transport ATPase